MTDIEKLDDAALIKIYWDNALDEQPIPPDVTAELIRRGLAFERPAGEDEKDMFGDFGPETIIELKDAP